MNICRLREMSVCGRNYEKEMRDDRSISECLILECDGEPYKECDINHVGKETWTKGYICSVISLVLELSLQNSRINVVNSSRCTGIYTFVDIDSQTRKCKTLLT